ncbi:hypothetical protein GGU10DRAFT_374062 [Lentinula aff. detonsa]|uniref:CAP-Gly domain-containing protein n=1 Tax=Lentinula aff. detonsa TaxID=2804958 RepID=A0AA38KHD0_9AGAR|nr:hypothetical protein GGU10DRAFT_374062 [Lentinula aff. detonsa]
MNSLPLVGDRISYSGHLGTVKFVGNVENTTGIWLGIEWDDPDRGKHDGVKDGKRYFSCRIPNAGSFIRPSVQVIRGVSFLQALKAKYVEDLYGSTSQEKVTLGSSNGAIEVEAVNLDKIRNKLANLGRIREVSLENEFVSRVDEPGSIRETCPNVHGLDLSSSLLSTWNVVADIAIELPVLQRLALKFVFSLMSSIQHFTPLPSRNRFAEVPLDTLKITNSFQSLTDLQLNGCLMSWRQIQHVTSFMPKLVSVELGSNQLCELEYDDIPNPHSSIRNINLEGNKCKDWTCICRSLCTYKHLDRVILTANEIDSIPPLTDVSFVLKELKHISLSSNNINSWNDLDALPIWCPSLTSLSVIGNPLVESGDEVRYSRPFIIARIPTLEILDSTAVSARERTDSELLYLSYISRRFSGSNISITQLMREHPRWKELSNKHGTTLSVSESVTHQDRLSSKLIEVQVQKMFASTPSEISEWTIPTSIRVLPTMSLKVFELKIRKTLNIEKDSRCSLWLKMSDGSWVELTDVAHDLDWLGLESGSQVVCCVTVR